MNKPNQLFWFTATCPLHVEELLEEEVKEILNPEKIFLNRGAVRFEASLFDGIDYLLKTKLASRVLLQIGTFFFKHPNDWSTAIKDLNLKKWLKPANSIKISTVLDQSAVHRFKNSHFLSLKMKDAICDFFKEETGRRPDVATENPDVPFMLRIEGRGKENKAILSIDLCGQALSNRGYRPPRQRAPLRENLAQAMIQSTRWNPLEKKFWDPMMGSGTFLLEAFLYAYELPGSWFHCRMANGLLRNLPYSFAKQKWLKPLEPQLEQRVQEIALSKPDLTRFRTPLIIGSDLHKPLKDQFYVLLKEFRVPKDVFEIDSNDFFEFQTPSEEILMLTNPPYDKRLETETEVETFVHDIGEKLKKDGTGLQAFLLLPKDLNKAISLRTSSKKAFFNGDIECRLLEYNLY